MMRQAKLGDDRDSYQCMEPSSSSNNVDENLLLPRPTEDQEGSDLDSLA